MERLAVEVDILSLPEVAIPARRAHSPTVNADREGERENSEEANTTAHGTREGGDIIRFWSGGRAGRHDDGRSRVAGWGREEEGGQRRSGGGGSTKRRSESRASEISSRRSE